MKILNIIIVLTTFQISFVYAQQNPKKVTVYDVSDHTNGGAINGNDIIITDKNLDKFAGTWIWKEGTNSLTLKLSKVTLHQGTNGNILDINTLTGQYQLIQNGKERTSVSGNELSASSGGKKDTINLFMDLKSRKTRVTLMVIYLSTNSIQIEIDKNRFESKNDRNFELKKSLILTRQTNLSYL